MIAQLPDYCLQGQEIWCSRVPLVCFYIVEWHLPDRVMRQFGMRQVVPDQFDTLSALHRIDMRGRSDQDWSTVHRDYIQLWMSRHDYIIHGDPFDGTMDYHDPYMQWYRRITRRFICRNGAVYDYMVSNLNFII